MKKYLGEGEPTKYNHDPLMRRPGSHFLDNLVLRFSSTRDLPEPLKGQSPLQDFRPIPKGEAPPQEGYFVKNVETNLPTENLFLQSA